MRKTLVLVIALLLCASVALAESAQEYAQYPESALPGAAFVRRDEAHPQLELLIHNPDTWRAGVTDEPIAFYLDADIPADLTGARYIEDAARKGGYIDLGVRLLDGETEYALVRSPGGVNGVLVNNDRLYEAGSGFDALLSLAVDTLEYRPGDMDFSGGQSVRATFEWGAGELYETDESGESKLVRTYAAGTRVVDDPDALRALDEMFANADFTVGGVNCPSPAFLHMEYSDGNTASFAVAINSFDLFFYRSVCFTAGDGAELIDLFSLRDTDFGQRYLGG